MAEMTAREAIQKAMEEIEKLRDKNDSEIHFMVEHKFNGERLILDAKEDAYKNCRGILLELLHDV